MTSTKGYHYPWASLTGQLATRSEGTTPRPVAQPPHSEVLLLQEPKASTVSPQYSANTSDPPSSVMEFSCFSFLYIEWVFCAGLIVGCWCSTSLRPGAASRPVKDLHSHARQSHDAGAIPTEDSPSGLPSARRDASPGPPERLDVSLSHPKCGDDSARPPLTATSSPIRVLPELAGLLGGLFAGHSQAGSFRRLHPWPVHFSTIGQGDDGMTATAALFRHPVAPQRFSRGTDSNGWWCPRFRLQALISAGNLGILWPSLSSR
ncbi:hypothetical protein FALBO_2070 [Fusarium albosuccineum]|uniref:Uncharacterized protein n=1 Tax=Fusarium albosuccineum TaxID=1237068 RepID=A0A8H4LM27_9HYPO|nr:hypothetical protein FALBO_2070 [Fusarium albosuccineum]